MVKDLFSFHSKEYSKFRPKYPEQIFSFLASAVNEHELAWDCATGSGQAALGLTPYFDKVIATDYSTQQLENAFQHEKIEYRKAQAESSGIALSSVDLITIATAVHLLDTNLFYPEAERVLKNGGVISAWNYTMSSVTKEIDRITDNFIFNTLESYWHPDIFAFFKEERKIKLPFKSIDLPEIKMEHVWSFEQFINFIFTWSAVQAYIKKHNANPIDGIFDELKEAWGRNEVRRIKWRFYFKASRK